MRETSMSMTQAAWRHTSIILLQACVLGLSLGSASAQSRVPDDCTFDQQALKQRMREVAARHGGGRLNAAGDTATWRLRNGDTVSVGNGGCADLGTSVTLRYGAGRRVPTTDVAIGRITDAIATYWSSAEAAHVADAIRAAKSKAVRGDDGTTVIEGPLEPGPGFSFWFELRLSPKQAWIAWQDG